MHPVIRNPFGTMDAPEPDAPEVMEFAPTVTLSGNTDDPNSAAWAEPYLSSDPLEGQWSSRWKGGADPTIPGDTPEKWKVGRAEVRVRAARLYLRFDWDDCRRHGLIEALRDRNNRLVGQYINLTNPKIVRPWVGLVVDESRIDGQFPSGRLDFRR